MPSQHRTPDPQEVAASRGLLRSCALSLGFLRPDGEIHTGGQAAIADALDYTKQTVSAWMRGVRPPSDAMAAAGAALLGDDHPAVQNVIAVVNARKAGAFADDDPPSVESG